MNPKKIVFLFSFLIVVFIIAEVQQIVADRDQRMLTAAEIKRSIQTKYPGKIEDIKFSKIAENKMYVVDLEGQNKVYTLKVDAYSGEILHLTQLKEIVSENSANIENEEIASFSS
ncbi:PepSY domain-containing protein [Metabacillus arenae]|uniref:PepSY domain-containing protein n=1 Tax=Metabacillus arenae TaxID=2771434 RepID=A0A926NFJ7_9BACI|nr:PepSY domain-containing protein [Metabacillus arenae]MBD1379890.1 PepSY domain-containing protein [Metabacillus arenae]